jgi:hypothetical protein
MADARAKARMLSPKLLRFCHFSGAAEHVRSARQVQTSTCSAIASASSTYFPDIEQCFRFWCAPEEAVRLSSCQAPVNEGRLGSAQ